VTVPKRSDRLLDGNFCAESALYVTLKRGKNEFWRYFTVVRRGAVGGMGDLHPDPPPSERKTLLLFLLCRRLCEVRFWTGWEAGKDEKIR